jgi:ABC-type polysaccharide/polyol phosphate transport system ATPase subunit
MDSVVIRNLSKVYKQGPKIGFSSRDWANLIFHGKLRPELKTFYALKNISITIKKGEIIGVIGKNGAGKSTLLKIISKVIYPTEGNIEVNGKLAGLLELGAGFHPDLTGRENIFFQAAILGMTKKDINNKQDKIIRFSGLRDFIDTPVKYYSSGMFARLGFSVAIHLEPDILLVDEVLSVGDAQFREKCINRIQKIFNKRSISVVFVSHNLGYVKELCKKVYWLDRGEITKQGDADSVINSYLESIKK